MLSEMSLYPKNVLDSVNKNAWSNKLNFVIEKGF